MSDSRVTYQQLIAFAAGELAGGQADRVEAYLAGHPEGDRDRSPLPHGPYDPPRRRWRGPAAAGGGGGQGDL